MTHETLDRTAVPLVVDVDGTLARTDLLWEGVAELIFRSPLSIVSMASALLRGRAALKRCIALRTVLDAHATPLDALVVRLIDEARRDGREVVLASAADELHIAALARRVGADSYIASDGVTNAGGARKAELIRERWPTFDYVGNASADLPMWSQARIGYVVRPPARLLQRAASRGIRLEPIGAPDSLAAAYWRSLRPHQWAKNLLIVVPALAAHLRWDLDLTLRMVAGFLAFCALSSALYLLNDAADIRHDRQHPRKRDRPIAAGSLPLPYAFAGTAVLIGIAAAGAALLPAAFGAALLTYLLLTVLYSARLKRMLVIDVITLALLYVVRVVAGGVLAGVVLSPWFSVFSVFLFFSLAVMKRTIELRVTGAAVVPGRGYQQTDVSVLVGLGSAASAATALVYCLYISTAPVATLYRTPALLWAGLPLLLYWLGRAWILANRGQMHDDPVVFALRDRATWAVGAMLLAVVAAAAW